jgi:hypothetical protein
MISAKTILPAVGFGLVAVLELNRSFSLSRADDHKRLIGALLIVGAAFIAGAVADWLFKPKAVPPPRRSAGYSFGSTGRQGRRG